MAQLEGGKEAGAADLVTAVEADLLVEGDLGAAELALGGHLGLLKVVAVAVLAEVEVRWVVLAGLLVVRESEVRGVNAVLALLLCKRVSCK